MIAEGAASCAVAAALSGRFVERLWPSYRAAISTCRHLRRWSQAQAEAVAPLRRSTDGVATFLIAFSRLDELAHDLWWSWTPVARRVFRRLDYPLWRLTAHNPVRMLKLVTPEILARDSADPQWLRDYDRAIARLERHAPPTTRGTSASSASLSGRSDCVLLGRVRLAPVAADLRRRSRRARRRPLQGSKRPGRAARRGRLHVPAGLLPSERVRRRLAGRNLRKTELDGHRDRAGDHTPDGKPCVTAVPLGSRTVLSPCGACGSGE